MLLEVSELNKSFIKYRKSFKVLSDFSMKLDRGEMIAVMGESGAGKSTLLNIIGGIMRPDSGLILFDSREVNYMMKKEMNSFRKEHIGFIVQDFALIKDRDVYENIELPLKIRRVPKAQRERRIMSVLEEVGLAGEARSFPVMLSGGEQQRVAIARALVIEPDIILADEPTGALDEENSDNILNMLRALCLKDKAVIVVTHDKAVAGKCDRVIKLYKGGRRS